MSMLALGMTVVLAACGGEEENGDAAAGDGGTGSSNGDVRTISVTVPQIGRAHV